MLLGYCTHKASQEGEEGQAIQGGELVGFIQRAFGGLGLLLLERILGNTLRWGGGGENNGVE